MKSMVLGFAILFLGATSSKTVELTNIIRNYTSWKQITPPNYSIPGHLSRLCTLPAHPGEIVEDDSDAEVPVRVFGNDLALSALRTRKPFPIGSVFVKEKKQSVSKEETSDYASILDDNLHQGVMIKSKQGWEFFYFPHSSDANYETCAACHKTAKHDSVFTPYIKE